MATVSKVLHRGNAATSNTTLYTTPAGTTSVITSIVVANTASTDSTFSLSLNDIPLADGTVIAAKEMTVIDLKQVLNATQTIKGFAGATTVRFHISGVEIT